MRMKTKLAKVALAAFIGIAAPSWGMDGKVTLFDDTNLTNPKFFRVSQKEDGSYTSKIKGTGSDGTPEIHIYSSPTVEFVGWVNNDEEHFALKKIKATADCESGAEITGLFTLAQEHPYTLLKQPFEVTEGSWFPLGEARTTYSITEYKRPDQTVFVDKKVLYTKTMEEIARSSMGPLNSYRGEEVQTTYQGGFFRNPNGRQTTRYFWNQSDQTSITVKIKTIFPDGSVETEQGSIIKVENTHAIGGDYGDGAIKLDQLDRNKYWIV